MLEWWFYDTRDIGAPSLPLHQDWNVETCCASSIFKEEWARSSTRSSKSLWNACHAFLLYFSLSLSLSFCQRLCWACKDRLRLNQSFCTVRTQNINPFGEETPSRRFLGILRDRALVFAMEEEREGEKKKSDTGWRAVHRLWICRHQSLH